MKKEKKAKYLVKNIFEDRIAGVIVELTLKEFLSFKDVICKLNYDTRRNRPNIGPLIFIQPFSLFEKNRDIVKAYNEACGLIDVDETMNDISIYQDISDMFTNFVLKNIELTNGII